MAHDSSGAGRNSEILNCVCLKGNNEYCIMAIYLCNVLIFESTGIFEMSLKLGWLAICSDAPKTHASPKSRNGRGATTNPPPATDIVLSGGIYCQ